jgi:hypothetical protein
MRRFVLLVVLLGCGPSSSEIKEAKTARYSCDYERVFKTVGEVVKAETPPLGVADQASGVVASDFRWHSNSGMRKKEGAVDVQQGDLGFVLEVAIGKDGAGFHIRARPRVFSQMPDSPRGQEITAAHADWPGWADAKADKVQVQIHEQLSDCRAPGA